MKKLVSSVATNYTPQLNLTLINDNQLAILTKKDAYFVDLNNYRVQASSTPDMINMIKLKITILNILLEMKLICQRNSENNFYFDNSYGRLYFRSNTDSEFELIAYPIWKVNSIRKLTDNIVAADFYGNGGNLGYGDRIILINLRTNEKRILIKKQFCRII